MTNGIEEVRGEKILIRFEGKRCIHSRHCVLERPEVFVPNVQGEWIHPDAVSAEDVVKVAEECPSGAIRYTRLDGGPEEAPPTVNLVRVRENGPLAFRAPLRIAGQDEGLRATLCRCGASKNKPFCDGSHVGAGFTATGEPGTIDSPALEVRDGAVEITPLPNGPLKATGNLEVVSGTGRTVKKATQLFFCRCGASQNKPYCDGTHTKIGFSSET